MRIKNVKVYGLDQSIIRAGYPMQVGEPADLVEHYTQRQMFPSAKNKDRANKLSNTPIGSGHDNFLKGIIVQFDLQYPEYFSPQLQRYHWIDIVSSQSKMHKITSRELTRDDFAGKGFIIQEHIDNINRAIRAYNNCNKNESDNKKHWFNTIIVNLPSGYLKWMGISTNYLQLKTIWNQRCKHKHKLDEWRVFGEFIQSLPMSELITGKI